ncbi:glycosyltransferase family 9 protein [Parvularcula maris]|uniref:Glycosyltransferase family 9 protein n=1 Tax=Parvularcula maris TaxID=2965077 RepID=A0A9X2RJ84_9PROT|nr:glycosyltransferase family 9 protein [Parvularcula maris]MCQ8184532.1 glycosyltransferase family 9 protein [Parvularcula maris]
MARMKGGASRILVIKRAGLRQFIEAEPVFASIREAHPRATIDLVTSASLQRLAKAAPYFDRVVATRDTMQSEERKQFAGQLKKIGYNLGYDLDGTKESGDLRSSLKGFRGPQWVGPKLSSPKKLLAPGPFAGPAVRKLLRDSGLPLEERLPSLSWLSAQEGGANMDPSWFGISGAFALFIPSENPQHRWPAEYYGTVAASLAAEGVTPVIIGSQELSSYAYDIMQYAVEQSRAGGRAAVDLTGKTDAAQLAVLAGHARFFLAGPSEELHLVAAAGTPGLVLLPASEDLASDALYGRQVVKLTATSMQNVAPELAVRTLLNMGLMGGASRSQGQAFA